MLQQYVIIIIQGIISILYTSIVIISLINLLIIIIHIQCHLYFQIVAYDTIILVPPIDVQYETFSNYNNLNILKTYEAYQALSNSL